jgi:hypothetical protein
MPANPESMLRLITTNPKLTVNNYLGQDNEYCTYRALLRLWQAVLRFCNQII